LIIAGNDDSGYQRKLEALAMRQGVGDRISFIGPVYGARKSALLRRAAALILPSYSENFGNVVVESMAAACPVIVTPEVGSAEVVQQTGGGVVLQGSPEALSAGINALLADPGKRREIGERGRDAIATRFTWTAIAAEMDKVYRIIVSGHPAGTCAAAAPVEASSK
jgi:glycosyltransferase involved in cell wall biosynthesis